MKRLLLLEYISAPSRGPFRRSSHSVKNIMVWKYLPDPGNPGPAPPTVGLRAERRNTRSKGRGTPRTDLSTVSFVDGWLWALECFQNHRIFRLWVLKHVQTCVFISWLSLLRVVFECKKTLMEEGSLRRWLRSASYSRRNHPRGGSWCQQYPILVYYSILFFLAPKSFYRHQFI